MKDTVRFPPFIKNIKMLGRTVSMPHAFKFPIFPPDSEGYMPITNNFSAYQDKYIVSTCISINSIAFTDFGQDNWRIIHFNPLETSQIKFIRFFPDGFQFIIIFSQFLIIYDTSNLEVKAKYSISKEKSDAFVDVAITDDKIYAIIDKGTVIVFSKDLTKLSEFETCEENTCISTFNDEIIIGTKKGNVLVFRNNEAIEKIAEFRASALEIKIALMNEDKIYTSSFCDTVLWSRDYIPLYSVRNSGSPIYPDKDFEYGVSIFKDRLNERDKIYLHKLVKGKKSDTVAEMKFNVDLEILPVPDFSYSEYGRNRLLFASPRNIYSVYIN